MTRLYESVGRLDAGAVRRWAASAVTVAVVVAACSGAALAAGLRPFVRGSWKQIRQAHQGRPLVVHFWGVTCAPCMGELPKWGELERSKAGVDIVFVAADPIPIEPPNIEAAVAKTGIGGAENWTFSDSFLERLRFEVNPQWGGELPYTVMISASGAITSTAGVMEQKDLRAWIAQQVPRAGAAR